jgi:hypothetical protein
MEEARGEDDGVGSWYFSIEKNKVFQSCLDK